MVADIFIHHPPTHPKKQKKIPKKSSYGAVKHKGQTLRNY